MSLDQGESLRVLSEAEIAWAAGLLEGEGTFGITKDKCIRIMCGMTDLDVLQKLQSILGGGISNAHHRKDYKPIYRWYLQTRNEVVQVLELLKPHMGKRRAQRIDELLEHHKKYPPGRPRIDAAQHGTISMYSNQKCKCDLCMEAGRAYRRNLYRRKKVPNVLEEEG